MAESEKVRQRPAEPLDRWAVPYVPRLVIGLLGILLAMVDIIWTGDFWIFGAACIIWLATLDSGEVITA